MSDMDYFGAYPEGCPSNDPEQRGDADGDGARPDVNREGFDPKYTGSDYFNAGSVMIDGTGSRNDEGNRFTKTPAQKSKGFPY